MATDTWVKFAFLAVLAVNLVQITFYRPLFLAPAIAPIVTRLDPARGLKPWPPLQSFKPWTRDSQLQRYDCEAYFGNGFAEEHRVLESIVEQIDRTNWTLRGVGEEESGSFRCFYSATLRVSVCEGRKMVMNLKKIKVARGGEELKSVMGRDEDDELPEYSRGAFQIRAPGGSAPLFDEGALDEIMPQGKLEKHPIRSLLRNLERVDSGSVQCAQRVKQPTVFVTRFEYANLFHTATDWFGAYTSSRVTGLAVRPRLVFLDGHCKFKKGSHIPAMPDGPDQNFPLSWQLPMDDGWEAMFSDVRYAMHFRGPVCFDHAIFAPLGYATPLFKHFTTTLQCAGRSVEDLEKVKLRFPKKRGTSRLREFGEFLVASFDTGTGNSTAVKSTAREGREPKEFNVVFIRREYYVAHPRQTERLESRLHNEEEVYLELENWAKEKSTKTLKITIVNGRFAHMPLGEQIKTVRKAAVLVGAHGAGLTHLLFASPTTKVLELSSPHHRGPHYATLSYWMGMEHRLVEMDSSAADFRQIRTEMNDILEDVRF